MSQQGYETLASNILLPAFWGDPLPSPLELIDPTETRDGVLLHRLTGNQEFLWLVTLYGLDPQRWAKPLLAHLAGQQTAFMGNEPNAGHPYFELYGRPLAAGLRFSHGRNDGVHEALTWWARSLLALCALGRLRDGRIILPGGRIAAPHSKDRDQFVALLQGTRDPAGHGRGGGYPQAVAMLAAVLRARQVQPLTPGPLPGLLWPMQVEVYERGVRLWFEHLGHPSGGPPRTPGGPWWAMAANLDGSRTEHVSWLTMGLSWDGPRGAKGWGKRRSLEIPQPVPAWDMGRRIDSFAVGPNGREDSGDGGPIAPPVEPPAPPKPPKGEPPPVEPGGDGPRWIKADHPPVSDPDLRKNQCRHCYLGHAQHGSFAVEGARNSARPGRVPRRAEGDVNRNPPNAWGMDALGRRR